MHGYREAFMIGFGTGVCATVMVMWAVKVWSWLATLPLAEDAAQEMHTADQALVPGPICKSCAEGKCEDCTGEICQCSHRLGV